MIRVCFALVTTGISRKMIEDEHNRDPKAQLQNPQWKNKAPLKPIECSKPMERVQVDLVDVSCLETEEGLRYVLVMVDVFSRFLWLGALRSKSCADCAKLCEIIWGQFGTPKYLQTDNGKEFLGEEMKDLCRKNNIKHIRGRPRHPQTQGKVIYSYSRCPNIGFVT